MKAQLRSSTLAAIFVFTLVGSLPATVSQTTDQAAAASTIATITLDEAIRRAEANEPAFAAAAAESRALRLEQTDARTALLPSAIYHNQVIYTEPNGQVDRIGQTVGEAAPVFIANNSIREYASQGELNETIGLGQFAAIRVADANAARATAELEVARRGLISTVVNLYYTLGSQDEKLSVAQRALAEANRFVQVTQQRENAGEAAHADVIKAQLQQQQRQRELADTKLAAEKARIEFGVLLFPDPSTSFQLAPNSLPPPLPERSSVEAAAKQNNPELKSALAALQLTEAQTSSARAALLPELNLNATYGIDAPQFATKGPDTTRNLGYSGSVQLDIPVWDWLSTERKIKESRLRTDAAKVALTAAQRRLVADLSEFYAEAATAQQELASLDTSVLTARESLRLTNLRYTAGESSVLDVVDAQNSLISAEDAQADGIVRYQLALAQLQTLTGRL
jgi:outer membrane protein TolC